MSDRDVLRERMAVPPKSSFAAAIAHPSSSQPLEKVVRPANQLQLNETEMKEEHTRVLTANDPNGETPGITCHFKSRT